MDTSPLTEATFCILLSMAHSPRHGYAILKDVESLSAGRVLLGTGTLYGALKRLLEQGWIERVENPEADEDGRPRKEYRLTETGLRILRTESVRLETLARTAALRLSGQDA